MFALHPSHPVDPNATYPDQPNIHEVDIFISTLCFLCAVLGVPANVCAFAYFIKQRKDLPTRLYMSIALVDIITCATVIPTGLSFAFDRRPILFGNDMLCQLWGILWVIVPFLSVYLVTVLSISRTVMLRNPLQNVSKRLVTWSILIYSVYLFMRIFIPVLNHSAHFIYSPGTLISNSINNFNCKLYKKFLLSRNSC